MGQIPKATSGPAAIKFDDWRRVFNPFVEMVATGHHTVRFRVRRKRGFTAVIVGILGFYLSLTGGAYSLVRYQQQVTAARYLDFLTPTRWTHVGVAQGDHQIAVARTLDETGQRLRALLLVSHGIVQSPANQGGRLLLAQLTLEA